MEQNIIGYFLLGVNFSELSLRFQVVGNMQLFGECTKWSHGTKTLC